MTIHILNPQAPQAPQALGSSTKMTESQLLGQYIQSLLQVNLGIALALRRVTDPEGREILDEAMQAHQFACNQLATVTIVSSSPPALQGLFLPQRP